MKIISAGSCDADNLFLKRMLDENFDSEIVRADKPDEVLQLLREGHFDLILVNRVFDVDQSEGINLIERIQKMYDNPAEHPAVMLISNYADAQLKAVSLGAKPGFGKSELNTTAPAERIRQAIGV